LQPSTRFLSRLNASQIAWIQHRFLEFIRSGHTGSGDPATVLARVKENLKTRPLTVTAWTNFSINCKHSRRMRWHWQPTTVGLVRPAVGVFRSGDHFADSAFFDTLRRHAKAFKRTRSECLGSWRMPVHRRLIEICAGHYESVAHELCQDVTTWDNLYFSLSGDNSGGRPKVRIPMIEVIIESGSSTCLRWNSHPLATDSYTGPDRRVVFAMLTTPGPGAALGPVIMR
jgi:hypothetical protein